MTHKSGRTEIDIGPRSRYNHRSFETAMETELTYTQSDPDSVHSLQQALDCHPVVARLLAARGIVTAEDARFFLSPTFERLTSPFKLKDMEAACARIYQAVVNGEKIMIFGDFDADGVTATSLVLEFFTLVEANVTWYIPHRTREGYSIQPDHIPMAVERDVDLIITVDCGITSHAAVEAAAREDIDVIITDHHEPGDELPPALAIVNPKRSDCSSELDFLAGVGVAFFLVMALRKEFREKGVWEKYEEPDLLRFLDLFAIGTIGDMVPLIRENRVLCLAGLRQIRKGFRPGIKALAQVARLNLQLLDSEDISFKLVPRINAAGRISHARICVSHLTSSHLSQAGPTAEVLEQLNLKRQQIEREIVQDIERRLERDPSLLDPKILMLWDRNWEASVLGIAASRLSKKYNRPVVLLSKNQETATGSCRSIGQINIHQVLTAHQQMLERFGGHAMAAGLTVASGSLDELRQALAAYMDEHFSDRDFKKQVTVDAELSLDEITPELTGQISSLMPFGTANPEPLFLCRNVWVADSVIIGTCHRKMVLKGDKTDASVEAIQFNLADLDALPTFFSRILFRLKPNKFRAGTPQLTIEEL